MSNIKSLLFDNKTIKQTILKNTFWLIVAEGVDKFLKLILIIYAARILGANEYGKFTFAFAFVSLFVVFSDLGLSNIITREFSRQKEKEKEFSTIFTLKILLNLGALILILAGSFFITPDFLIQKIIWILGIYILVDSFGEIIFAFFRARQKMEYESGIKILKALAITGAGFFILFNFPSAKNLSYSYLFSSLIVLIFLVLFFHFKIHRLSFSYNKRIWQRFLAMSWPLALAGVFGTIYTSIDSAMMGYWGQIAETGWYNAAYKIIGIPITLMSLICYGFYPVLSKAFKESKVKLQNIWSYQMEIMIFLAVPLVIGGITLASRIISFVYGSNYIPSVLAFQILIIMVGIIFPSAAFSQTLLVSDQQKKVLYAGFWAATTNVILNLILIPKFSLYGAAFTTVISYLLMFFLLLRYILKFTSVKFLSPKFLVDFAGAIFSGGIMYFIISQPIIYHLSVLFLILTGIIVYSGFYFLYRKLVVRFVYLKLK